MHRLAYVFPGQGSQYVGMGKKLSQNSKRLFEEASDILHFDLKKLCFEGKMETLTRTDLLQPAILTVSVGMFRDCIDRFGGEPTVLAGHSLGEFSALCCGGVLQFSDALSLVKVRGELMQKCAASADGAMAAISGLDKAEVEEVCREITGPEATNVSGYNSKTQFTISGHRKAVLKAVEMLDQKGGKSVLLHVNAAFHSSLMSPMTEEFRARLELCEFHQSRWKVLSNVTAQPHDNVKENIINRLVSQVVSPVDWASTIEYMIRNEIFTAVEVGPKHVLTNLFKGYPIMKAFSYENGEEMVSLGQELAVPENRLLFISRCLAVAICLKNSNWDEEEYREKVVSPYQNVQRMYNELCESKEEPTVEQMKQALDMLKTVITAKQYAEDLGNGRIQEIIRQTGTEVYFTS
ncbi:ACP S-malonyltransferase [Paenibacillus sp.]|jgi:[acyl-carrier-protein] S-malonyltransferase|uniref:ACP S-malonyltransferase n=1 Tax=Paenibacillus sp. TaxID=58172 RepID=UPI00282251DB|nr:ACP S-malonyltransferase [Paenibacillus sp.]MDR0268845.1 ACP S-malonyltransferase [Paenibacillus sp.]